MFIYVYICVCMYVYMYTYIYLYIANKCWRMKTLKTNSNFPHLHHAHIYIHTHIYIHSYIYIHAHTRVTKDLYNN